MLDSVVITTSGKSGIYLSLYKSISPLTSIIVSVSCSVCNRYLEMRELKLVEKHREFTLEVNKLISFNEKDNSSDTSDEEEDEKRKSSSNNKTPRNSPRNNINSNNNSSTPNNHTLEMQEIT